MSTKSSWPADFEFGTATAALQIEGAPMTQPPPAEPPLPLEDKAFRVPTALMVSWTGSFGALFAASAVFSVLGALALIPVRGTR